MKLNERRYTLPKDFEKLFGIPANKLRLMRISVCVGVNKSGGKPTVEEVMFSSFTHLTMAASERLVMMLNTAVFGAVAGACCAPLPPVRKLKNRTMNLNIGRDSQGSRFGTFSQERPETFYFAHPLRM